MSSDAEGPITLSMMRQSLYSAVVSDALDALGYRKQSPRVAMPPLTVDCVLVGRCRTTRWVDLTSDDPDSYELELKVVDSCEVDDVIIAAGAGSMLSGVWGELLSTAARNCGCIGAIIQGAVRDVAKLRTMQFPVFAQGTSAYDSMNRQRVVDIQVPVEIDGVIFNPYDLVIADVDAIVVVPRAIEDIVIQSAWKKAHAENAMRDAIRGGMMATEAYQRFGIL